MTYALDQLKVAGFRGLKHGGGSRIDEACVMNAVHALYQLRHFGVINDLLTDHPPCTDPAITAMAIQVNDQTRTDELDALESMIERLYLAHPIASTDKRRRVMKRVCQWLVEQYPEPRNEEELLKFTCLWTRAKRARSADVASDAAASLFHLLYDLRHDDALGRRGKHPGSDVILLSDLLDVYDKARAEEGVLLEGSE